MSEEYEVDPSKPSYAGLGLLTQEFLNKSAIPVQREDIDWETVAWEEFGWTPTNLVTHVTHKGQVEVMNSVFRLHKKVIIVRAGKRSGKTTVNLAAAKVMHKKVPGARGWIASSTYDLADKIFMPLFQEAATGAFGKIIDKSRKDRRIHFEGGGLAQAKSWDDPDAIEGESLDYLIGDEAQTLDEDRFNLLYARTVDRNGVLILIGSPAADDTFFLGLCEEARVRSNWAYVEWTLWDNPFPDEDFIRVAQGDLSAEAFAEMFENKIRTPRGLVFSKEYDSKMSLFRAEPDPKLPMYVCIDPGTTNSAYAVGFVQIIPGNIEEVRLYDEIYEHQTFSEMILKEQVLRHKYWPMVVSGVMDIAGRQKHDKADSPKDLWQSIAKIPIEDVKVDILMGIERMKGFLLQPNTGLRKLRIHERCVLTQKEFMHYRYANNQSPNVGERRQPIDAFNHMIKALTYFLVYHYGYWTKDGPRKKTRGRYLE